MKPRDFLADSVGMDGASTGLQFGRGMTPTKHLFFCYLLKVMRMNEKLSMTIREIDTAETSIISEINALTSRIRAAL